MVVPVAKKKTTYPMKQLMLPSDAMPYVVTIMRIAKSGGHYERERLGEGKVWVERDVWTVPENRQKERLLEKTGNRSINSSHHLPEPWALFNFAAVTADGRL